MARSRNIKPGFFKNEHLASMDPYARLLFIGLWTIADKEGRFEVRLGKIRAECFPHEQVMLESCMAQLWSKHFITLYEVAGKHFGQVNNWRRHQSPHHKEVDSEIPSCDEEKIFENQEDMHAWLKHESSMDQSRFKHSVPAALIPDSLNLIPDSLPSVASPENSGDEDEKSPEEPEPATLMVLPTNLFNTQGETFRVTEDMAQEWQEAFPAIDVISELAKARVWLQDNPTKRKTARGMRKFLGGWMSRQQDRGGSPGGGRAPSVPPGSTRQRSIEDDLTDTSWATGGT